MEEGPITGERRSAEGEPCWDDGAGAAVELEVIYMRWIVVSFRGFQDSYLVAVVWQMAKGGVEGELNFRETMEAPHNLH